MHVLFEANAGCPVHSEIMGLVVKTMGVADVLRTALASHRELIECAFIYGSFARSKQHAESDVDIVVVSENLGMSELVQALKPAQERLGREVNPMLYRRTELADKLARGHHFLTRVMREPKISLFGDIGEFGAVA